MNMNPRGSIFNRRPQNNIYRVFLYLLVILAGTGIYLGIQRGTLKPIGDPTLTPTRSPESFKIEGDAQFTSGDLESAISSYRKALDINPNDAQIWATLARIQTYNSSLKTIDADRRTTLTDALNSINKAKTLAPDDSTVAAIRAFVLDWNSSPSISGDKAAGYLVEAEQEAVRALNLDNTNTLALAYYAEIMIDQQRITQAEQNILKAVDTGQNIMDVHRVYAYLLETEGVYNQAIDEYNKAIAITPNLTFLYMRAGANYRTMAFKSVTEEQKTAFYASSLEYFAKAAAINDQLGIKDPTPYLSIAKTYSQLGEYYAAGRNVQKALTFDPSNPDVYGQLGIVFTHSRNFEGAIPALKCAILGCTASESCDARGGCDTGDNGTEVKGLGLSPNSIVYYYSYISNLAALSRPKSNHCPEALGLINEIRTAGYNSDPIVESILKENENICAMVGKGIIISDLTPTPPLTAQPTLPFASATPSPTPIQ